MKVRVSGLVWVPKASLGDSIPSLRKSLTIVPRKTMYDTDKPTPVKCFGETIDEFGFPRDYFFSTAVHNHDVTWALCDGHPTNYESMLKQEGNYAEQGTALDVLEAWFGGFESQLALDGPIAAGKRLGGILNADPAFGKTATALELAKRIGRTTLIIVHKEFLLTQWIKSIRRFMPDAKVGIVREDKCQFEGMDFVIAMVQSLAMEGADGKRRYPLDFYNWPGQVYLDESLGYRSEILTDSGYRCIGEIVEGSDEVRVLAFDTEARQFEWRSVTRRWVHRPRSRMLRIIHERGTLECTANHEVLTAFGYKRAGNLVPGDSVVCYDHVETRQLAENDSVGGGICDGGWVSDGFGEREKGEVSCEPFVEASGPGGCKVRGPEGHHGDAAEDAGEQGLGSVVEGVQHSFGSGVGGTVESFLSGREEGSECRLVERELVERGNGLVGDGRWFREHKESIDDSSHGGVWSEEGRGAGGVVDAVVGRARDRYSDEIVFRTEPGHSGFVGGGPAGCAVGYRVDEAQGRSNTCWFSGEAVYHLWRANCPWPWGGRSGADVLRRPAVSAGSEGNGIGTFQGKPECDLRALQIIRVRGVRWFHGNSSKHQAPGVLGSLLQGKGDSSSTGAVLRSRKGVPGKHSVTSRILSIEEVDNPLLVYDLSVGEHHNFVADGVVVHNCHRIGALTWSPAPRMFPARVRVGLSATLRRRDGADKVFWWHIGAVQYKATTKRPLLDVRMVESNMRGPDFIHTDQVSPSTVVNIMVKQSKRNQLIIREIVKALKSPHKRKLMILSERLEHLRELDKILARAVAKEKLEDVTTGFYVGQWFTGETSKALTKRGWKMDDEGREAAVAKIYLSMSRKRPPRAYKDADGARILKLENGELDLDELLLVDKCEGMDVDVAKIERAAADAAIFGIAKEFGIAQKAVEKKKKRTEAELDEAEQSRVIWACVTADVECLTLGGWKVYGDLEIGESVASYNMSRGVIEYTPLLEVRDYDYDGDLAHIDRRRVDVGMTWNHRNVVSSVVKRDGGARRVERMKQADELTAHDKLVVMAPVDYPEESESIGDAMAELVGWIVAEGTYVKDCWGGVVIYQNEGEHADRIDALLRQTAIACRRSEYRPGQISWHIGESDAVAIKTICPDKLLSRRLVGLRESEARALFNGLVDGDGHRRKDTGRICFVQKDRMTVDWFMVLAMRLGYTPLVSPKSGGMWVVYLSEVTHVGLRDKEFRVKPMPYQGKVWCPRTANGTWVARSRGGGVFITGNTYQMCSEGVSIDPVDTLGFVTPISDIEQTYGRGRRVCVPERHGGDKPLETCKRLCPWRWETCTEKPKGIAFDIIDDRIPMPKRRKGYRLEFYDSVKARVSGAGS